MHIVRGEDLVLLGCLFSSHLNKAGQIDLIHHNIRVSNQLSTYFLTPAFKETLVEDEIVKVDIFQHVMNFVVRSGEWLGNVHAKLFLQEDEGYHPVGFPPGIEVILVKWGHTQEFKHLVFVNILTHIAHDVRLQFLQLEQLAKIYKVKLILVCKSQIFCSTGNMLK